jgi:hypothetical protein
MEIALEILRGQARIGESAARTPVVHTRPDAGLTLGRSLPVMSADSQLGQRSAAVTTKPGGLLYPMISPGRGPL